jgi:hypothetical protein
VSCFVIVGQFVCFDLKGGHIVVEDRPFDLFVWYLISFNFRFTSQGQKVKIYFFGLDYSRLVENISGRNSR